MWLKKDRNEYNLYPHMLQVDKFEKQIRTNWNNGYSCLRSIGNPIDSLNLFLPLDRATV